MFQGIFGLILGYARWSLNGTKPPATLISVPTNERFYTSEPAIIRHGKEKNGTALRTLLKGDIDLRAIR